MFLLRRGNEAATSRTGEEMMATNQNYELTDTGNFLAFNVHDTFGEDQRSRKTVLRKLVSKDLFLRNNPGTTPTLRNLYRIERSSGQPEQWMLMAVDALNGTMLLMKINGAQ